MKGIVVEKVGGPFTLVDTLDKPKPSSTQVLVKSLVTAINPVEGYMQGTGLLVTAWPIVLGCDASGVVVEVGDDVKKFKEGDHVFGCTRLGVPGHSTFQEYFLMDELLTFQKAASITVEAAATVGVGLLTACLALVVGTKIDLEQGSAADPNEWIIVLGGAGSVGQYAVQDSGNSCSFYEMVLTASQAAKLCGYKVLASCSPSSDEFVKNLGADATFSYKLPLKDQLAEVESFTKGNYLRCFDASAMATETGMEALAQGGDTHAEVKYFATTNGWSTIEPKNGIEVCAVDLGMIGRSGSDKSQVDRDIEGFIPKLEKYLCERLLKPMGYEIVGDVGVAEVLKGLDAFNARKGGEKKVLVRLAAE
ncbi:GroES-like protein [Mollisia scopiformis]|uniref:GroES-like protein n=1 Tax=Mollisia scopiformis TaxID=149040 RepID=A0A194XDF1_MOLSC|nr:GroES-like protein [Mollisia scopiformis]KUJ17782.1 GroES-like protein [Mollisia scopiformis]